MKIKKLITLSTLCLGFGATIAFSPIRAVCAETESEEIVEVITEEKTYVYVEDELQSATLVLKDDGTFTLFLKDGEEESCFDGTYTRDGVVVSLFYMDETLIVDVDDELGTFDDHYEPYIEEEEEKESIIDNIKNEVLKLKDTFVTPLIIALASIDLGAVLSAIIMAALRKVSDKKRDAKLDENNANFVEIVKESKELIEKINTAQSNFENMYRNSLQMMEDGLALLKEAKKDCDQVTSMKQSIIAMSESMILLAKTNPEAFKNGLTEQLAELEKRIAELDK